MAVIIRLRRMGAKKKPIYRIVATDSRNSRDGGRNVEVVGHYDPNKTDGQVDIKRERIKSLLNLGAQLSDTVRSILKKEGFFRQAVKE